jgi:signal transduction histidine kinase
MPYDYQYLLFVGLVVSTLSGSYAVLKRRMPGSVTGGVLILCGSLWTLTYLLQIYSETSGWSICFFKAQTMIGNLVPAIFTIYVSRYFEFNLNPRYRKIYFYIVWLIPAITSAQIILGDPFHMVWRRLTLLDYNQVAAVQGPSIYLINAWNYILILFNLTYFIYTLSKPQQVLKTRIIAYMIALIGYSVTDIPHLLDLTPYSLTFTPLVVNIMSSSIMLLNPERIYKMDILPIAFNIVMDRTTNPVIITDTSDKVIYLNEAARSLLGVEKVRFLERNKSDLLNDLNHYASLGNGTVGQYFEYGDEVYQVGLYPVEDWQSIVRSKIYVLNNVTEIVNYSRHLESMVEEKTEQLRVSERMATIGKMTTMVGHDLRNPLQVIRFTVDLLGKKFRDDSMVSEIVTRLDRNVLYMDKIVSDLQLFSSDDVSRTSTVRLRKLLDEALRFVSDPKNIDFVFNVPSDYLVSVEASSFERVVVNLLNNAVQAMPDGGKVIVDVHGDGGFDVISVKDFGVGISEDDMGKLFKPFYTTKAKGAGLGLSVCKQIVEAHGGEIWFESVLGGGSIFYVKIPHDSSLDANELSVEADDEILDDLIYQPS